MSIAGVSGSLPVETCFPYRLPFVVVVQTNTVSFWFDEERRRRGRGVRHNYFSEIILFLEGLNRSNVVGLVPR